MNALDKAKITNLYNDLYKTGHLLSHVKGNLFVSDTDTSRRLLGNARARFHENAYRSMYQEESYQHRLLMAEDVFTHFLPNQAKFSAYFNAMCWDDENPYAIIQRSNPSCSIEAIHGYVENLSGELMTVGEGFIEQEASIFLQSMIASQLALELKSESLSLKPSENRTRRSEFVNKPFDMVYQEGFLLGLTPEQMTFRAAIENAFDQVSDPKTGILDSLKDGVKQHVAPLPIAPAPHAPSFNL